MTFQSLKTQTVNFMAIQLWQTLAFTTP